jgi:N-acetylneuraminate synthase
MTTIELICELSGNHAGDMNHALALITHAADAGATGVKLQCFEPERLAVRRAAHLRIKAMSLSGGDLQALYRDTHTPRAWFPALIGAAQTAGLTWHASVFDPDDVAFLETLDCPRYKIASFEADDDILIEAAAATGKPLIISINQESNTFHCPPKDCDYMLLHTTNYGVPAKNAEMMRVVRVSQGMRAWGLSDHTTSNYAGEAAAVLGARMIEWHMKLRGVETPDNAFSWLPHEFAYKARRVREIVEMMDG